jgi:hypothetical protein
MKHLGTLTHIRHTLDLSDYELTNVVSALKKVTETEDNPGAKQLMQELEKFLYVKRVSPEEAT